MKTHRHLVNVALVLGSLGFLTFAAPREANAFPGCTCTGTGIDGPFTIACAQTVCGTDGQTYTCTAQDTYSAPGAACSASGCSGTCSGTGLAGPFSNLACGATVCGTDSKTYACTGQDTFSAPGADCTSSCTGTCSGTGLDGPFTALACGATVCGTDSRTYTCTGQETFSDPGAACGSTCTGTCSGTGLAGPFSNLACGSTVCGSDAKTYTCTGQDTFSGPGADCASCTCNGTGIDGPFSNVACGSTICGTDSKTYTCAAGNTFSGPGADCTASCPGTCSGTGAAGAFSDLPCGSTVCGVDEKVYTCIGQDAFSAPGASCSACSGGLTNCGGACTDTTTDASHCGGCDVACSDGEVCSASACSRSFRLTDTSADDASPTALFDFLSGLGNVAASQYVFIELDTLGAGGGGAICSDHADYYVNGYLSLAATGGNLQSDNWVKRSRPIGGNWSLDSGAYTSSFGPSCDGNPYSWCFDSGLGSRYLGYSPAGDDSCEIFENAVNGCSGGQGWTLKISVGNDSSVCGIALPTCADGVKNQGEAGIDCGGPCAACTARCTDSVKDSDEDGVDCGGTFCAMCPGPDCAAAGLSTLVIDGVKLCYTSSPGTCQDAHTRCEGLGSGYRLMCGDDWQPGRTGEGCGGPEAYTAYDLVNQYFPGAEAIGGYSQAQYNCVNGGANNDCSGDSGNGPSSNVDGKYAFCSPKNFFEIVDGADFAPVCGN